jgi:ADP-ribose pyrophosphatase
MKFVGVREDASFRLIERQVVFQGKVVGLSVDHIRLPGGHEARHEVLHLPSAVCVVPLCDGEDGRREVVLVEQFRNSLEGFIHEIPAGILEDGEDPADCAARELEEETGYTASRITHLATLFPIPGTSAHQMYFYTAEGLRPGKQCLEASECLTVKKVPLDVLLDAVLGRGQGAPGPGDVVIVDAKTHIGILHLALRLKGDSLRESSP